MRRYVQGLLESDSMQSNIFNQLTRVREVDIMTDYSPALKSENDSQLLQERLLEYRG